MLYRLEKLENVCLLRKLLFCILAKDKESSMMQFLQFLFEKILELSTSLVGLISGFVQIVEHVKNQKTNNEKQENVESKNDDEKKSDEKQEKKTNKENNNVGIGVAGAILVIAFLYIIILYAMSSTKTIESSQVSEKEMVSVTEGTETMIFTENTEDDNEDTEDIEELVTEELVSEEPVPEEPVPEESVPEEPISEEAVPEEPVPDEPVPEEPVIQEPISTQAPNPTVEVMVTGVVLDKYSVDVNIGDVCDLNATVLYSDNTSGAEVIWISSNESIVSVDQSGCVVAHAAGVVEVIAQASRNNSTCQARCIINVSEIPSGYTISVSATRASLYENFNIYIEPYNEATKIVVYAVAPSGETFAYEYTQPKFYIDTEIGTWTIYASIENNAGIYEAAKSEDFVTIEIVPLDYDSLFP